MANLVTMKINGKEVKVQEGQNLIDAAESAGVHIPNLCYLKEMKGIGACRMCLVEIEGMKAPVTACTMKAKEGMSIQTETERVREVRKFVTDLIVSMHPLDCMTCTKASDCNLMKYAYDFEIKESTFTRKKFAFGVDDANPFIRLDPDYCVLCARCIRVCKHQDTNILEFKGRGVGMKVIAGNDQPLHETDCTFCGSCIDVCPVNAIIEADRWRKGREWDYDEVKSTCLLCGNACDIHVYIKNGMISKVHADVLQGSPERYICAYGRFGFDCISVDTRVTVPMKRVNGELKETTWHDAVETIAEKLKKAGENAGFISTAGMLNEDALMLKRFASDVVKTKNIDSTASLYGDADTLISGDADIESADLIVLVDLKPSQWEKVLPALDAVIRRKVNSGAKLITINSTESKIASVAAVSIIEDEASALKSLAKALIDKGLKGDKQIASAVSEASVSEAVEKAAALIMESKNPLILSSPSMYPASANISLLKGAAVSVPIESNAKGVALMGLVSEGKSYKEMVSGGLGLLYAIGELPFSKRPGVDFLVVQNSHMTEIAKQADIVLPSAAYLEIDGTIVDYLVRMKNVCKAVEPLEGVKTHREIFADIAKAMGVKMKDVKESDIKKLVKVKKKAVFSPFARKEGLEVNAEEMIESMNASVINGSRLLWLKETEAALDQTIQTI